MMASSVSALPWKQWIPQSLRVPPSEPRDDLPLCDDVVQYIFLQLDWAALISAACVCRRWRQLIVDPCFLRLFKERLERVRAVEERLERVEFFDCRTDFPKLLSGAVPSSSVSLRMIWDAYKSLNRSVSDPAHALYGCFPAGLTLQIICSFFMQNNRNIFMRTNSFVRDLLTHIGSKPLVSGACMVLFPNVTNARSETDEELRNHYPGQWPTVAEALYFLIILNNMAPTPSEFTEESLDQTTLKFRKQQRWYERQDNYYRQDFCIPCVEYTADGKRVGVRGTTSGDGIYRISVCPRVCTEFNASMVVQRMDVLD